MLRCHHRPGHDDPDVDGRPLPCGLGCLRGEVGDLRWAELDSDLPSGYVKIAIENGH
jgi:hypothetical protein